MDRSLVRFYAGIRTEQTRKDYERYLGYFLKFVKIKEAGGLLQLKDNYLQELVEDYVISLKSRGLSKSYIDGQIAGLELFFSMNDKVLNFKKIRKMTPARKKPKGERPYTNEEVKRMLELTSSLRNKAVIHLIASTGCRIGAIADLKLRDVSEMPDGCKSVIFYRGEPEEYTSFLTPEASKALDTYWQKRQDDREYMDENSPVFRDAYRVGIGKVKRMSLKALRNMFSELVIKIFGRVGRNNHRDAAMTHAFRKRFDTILKNNKEINLAVAEKLMSHSTRMIPLDTTYHVPSKLVLFTEFKKAIIDLTLDNSEREHRRRVEAERKVTELETEKDRKMSEMELKLKTVEGLVEELRKKL